MKTFPIDDVLPALGEALKARGLAVLQAPPGAGKTTQVPQFLLREGLAGGRILMLEPRRVAARAAASFIAASLGEKPGGRVGFRVRGASRVSGDTVLEVVTEGILTAMIQRDPDLPGVGCIIFDEFHERSIHADLGLALALEIRDALRPDLQIVVMSATLDAEPVAALMGEAPVITSRGTAFDVETIRLDRPWRSPNGRERFETAMASLIRRAVQEQDGSVLAFLPGAPEIHRVSGLLADLPEACEIVPLFGAMPFEAQSRALRPAPAGRRHIVLATSIAETSLTIPDIRVVVDGGLARRPRFDPSSGLARLTTERVTRAEATQRQGRAGRVAPGVCYRLWTKGEEGGLQAHPPVAILDDDLMGLALSLAAWGARDAAALAFLTPPPAPTLAEARARLHDMGALDGDGALTGLGRAVADTPLHPRLAIMLARARDMGQGPAAALLATLLETPRGAGADLGAALRAATREQRQAAARLARDNVPRDPPVGLLLAFAFPDRIARRREPGDARFLLSNGRGALLRSEEVFAGDAFLVVADLDGAGRDATIRRAAALAESDLRTHFADRITTGPVCNWDKRTQQVLSQEQERLGALVLRARPSEGDPDEVVGALIGGIRQIGVQALPWTRAARSLCDRANWVRTQGADLPDMGDSALTDDLEQWLAPYLTGMYRRADLDRVDLVSALKGRLGWAAATELETLAPARFTLPTGNTAAVDYSGDVPKIAARLQEFLGTRTHPRIGPARTPLLIELLSPAQRPIQTTADLPGFWSTSYGDVRKDMRGRYPKHFWPENPEDAAPTSRARPRRA